jgi:hypothetical protein
VTLDVAPAVTIRDDDLVAELEQHRGRTGFEFKRIELETKQRQRDRLSSLSRDARRRDEVRRRLEDTPSNFDDLRHIHSVLAMCGLPYTRQPLEVRECERKQGRMSLVVEAGKLRNPSTGEREPQPF